jgi:dolichol kinase
MAHNLSKETGRQLLHAALGLLFILLLFLLGRGHLMALLTAVFLIGCLIINYKMLGSKLWFADWFIQKFDRDETRFPGYGSAWFVLGALMLTAFLHNTDEIAAGLFVLGFGDAISTLVGLRTHNPHKFSFNKSKSIEGSFAFFLVSLLAFVFIGWKAILLALVATVVEALPLPYDDNITIPIATVLLFAIL